MGKFVIDEDVRGTIGDVSAFSVPGLDNMKRAARGENPPPPIHHLTGIKPTDAGIGTAAYSMPVTKWLEDSLGVIHGGVYAFLADAALASALLTGMPPGRGVNTSQLFLSYVRPSTRRTGNLVARARSVYVGREVGISETTIEDNEGRLMAYGSTRCVFPDIPVEPGMDLMPRPEPVTDPPDPYLREVPDSAYADLAEYDTGVPVEMMQRTIRGEQPTSPSVTLGGFEYLSVEPGRNTMRMRKSPWFSAGGPAMYGGMIAWGCDEVLGGAVYSTLSPGEVYASLDMEVRFLRPVFLDEERLMFTGEVEHSGRRIRVAKVDVTDEKGKRVAMAVGSAMIVPGGVRELMRGRLADEIYRG
ncbi:MAG: hotdog fold thioesterase [Acidimicrobiia bacterium]|nr:hotdog fold thioesterase [Acidimicrobiia bacterium]